MVLCQGFETLDKGMNFGSVVVIIVCARTVRGPGSDGPRPQRKSCSSSVRFRMAHDWRRELLLGEEPESHLAGGTRRRGQIQRVVLGRQANQDIYRRQRAEER